MKRVLLLLVRAYRLAISPLFPPRCRFLPSCSEYAVQALERHGAITGGWLALRRFLRCNPLNPGGIDEVPDNAGDWFTGFGASGAGRSRRWHAFGCLCHGRVDPARRESSAACDEDDAAPAVSSVPTAGAPDGNRPVIQR